MHDSTRLVTESTTGDSDAPDNLYGAPLLSSAEEQQLFRRYVATHDLAIREQIILANTRLVRELAGKFHPRGAMTREDIESEGFIGLMTAVERFDPERGFKFSTYATNWIRQRISRALADQAEIIREPVHVQTKRAHAKRHEGTEGAAPKLPRTSPSRPWRMVSLDTPILNEFGSDNPDGSSLADLIPAPQSQGFEEEIGERDYLRSTLYVALGTLSARERYVLTLRFGLATGGEDCWTLEAVGKSMNITRERVRQIERDALHELRRMLTPAPDGDAMLRVIDDMRVARLARLREARVAQLVEARAKRKYLQRPQQQPLAS
jgi:RNA polymerase sigma factor (sigma-70 family)